MKMKEATSRQGQRPRTPALRRIAEALRQVASVREWRGESRQCGFLAGEPEARQSRWAGRSRITAAFSWLQKYPVGREVVSARRDCFDKWASADASNLKMLRNEADKLPGIRKRKQQDWGLPHEAHASLPQLLAAATAAAQNIVMKDGSQGDEGHPAAAISSSRVWSGRRRRTKRNASGGR